MHQSHPTFISVTQSPQVQLPCLVAASCTVPAPKPSAATRALLAQEDDVVTCCCWPQGHAVVSLNLDKDAYTPGETAQMLLQVDNSRSSIGFKRVEV